MHLIRFEDNDFILIVRDAAIGSMNYANLVMDHKVTRADVTMAAMPYVNGANSRFGVLSVTGNGAVDAIRFKPQPGQPASDVREMTNVGIYLFNRKLLIDLADRAGTSGADFEHDVIPNLVGRGYVSAYNFANERDNYCKPIVSPDDYHEASMELIFRGPHYDPDADDRWPHRHPGPHRTQGFANRPLAHIG
jgi:glucose-1-phosphate adenylyltransferase